MFLIIVAFNQVHHICAKGSQATLTKYEIISFENNLMLKLDQKGTHVNINFQTKLLKYSVAKILQ